MWPKKRHEPSVDETSSAYQSLIEECAAFLSGHYADYLTERKLPIPAWAWLNAISHGCADDIRLLAARQCATGPSAVIADVAAQMVRLIDTRRLGLRDMQTRVLVPLECRLAAGHHTRSPNNADEMTQMLRSAMAEGLQWPPRGSAQRQARTENPKQRRPFTERFWEV